MSGINSQFTSRITEGLDVDNISEKVRQNFENSRTIKSLEASSVFFTLSTAERRQVTTETWLSNTPSTSSRNGPLGPKTLGKGIVRR